MRKSIFTIVTLGLLLSSCSTNSSGWRTANYYDEFTEVKTCRVEKQSIYERDFMRGFTGNYFMYLFFAENRNGEVRAGVMSEPPIPIAGDVQIKVGSKLITLTTADTPLDVAPAVPTFQDNSQLSKSMKELTTNITKLSSPYRAFTGKKATDLLKDINSYQGEVKFRTVGVNAQTSGTGSFIVDSSFGRALEKCDIKL